MADREVIVTRGGGTGWFVAGALAVAAIIGAILYANGYFDSRETIELRIDVPDVDLPDVEVERQ